MNEPKRSSHRYFIAPFSWHRHFRLSFESSRRARGIVTHRERSPA